MMYLQKVFDDLAYGEFANIKMGQSELSTLTEKDFPRIISALNLGLIELAKRFKLKEKEVTLHPYTDTLHYYLRDDYLTTADTLTDILYLVSVNAADPFNNDLIQVLEAYDDLGDEIPLNDSACPDTGIFLPTFDSIKISEDCELTEINLVYQAYLPPIEITSTFNPKTYKLYWPDYIMDAILNFVAARVFKGKTSKAAEGTTHLSMTFLQQFENACANIRNLGLINESTTPHKRVIDNGWV